jgi:hypothetical protein
VGLNVVDFSDLDSCNFITSSVQGSTPSLWYHSGANKQGLLGSDDIDIISSGNLKDGDGVVNLWKTQSFSSGDEDLSIDITTIVSATLKDIIPDHGFRISYSGSEETDQITRFVKRFSSTQAADYVRRPRLIVTYNNSTQDHHKSFFFNVSGSLFLNNFHRGTPSNILSGASATEVKGANSLLLELRSGSLSGSTFFQKFITASQHKIGDNFITGAYSASFAISQWSTASLTNEIKNAASATFTEIWSSLDKTVGYLTGSIVVNSVDRTSFNNQTSRLLVSVTNMQPKYVSTEKVRFRIFIENIDRPVKYKKVPFVTPSQIFTSMYYRIRDCDSDEVIIPFETSGGTLCSTDSDGMYFDVYMDSLFKGRLYTIDFLVKDKDFDQTFTDVAAKFRVD